MQSPHPILRRFKSDWKIVLVLSLTVFAVAMWYGNSHSYDDIGLYALAMALASWIVCGQAVFTVRKWQEWRAKSSGERGS